jgi:hypothetical protein
MIRIHEKELNGSCVVCGKKCSNIKLDCNNNNDDLIEIKTFHTCVGCRSLIKRLANLKDKCNKIEMELEYRKFIYKEI